MNSFFAILLATHVIAGIIGLMYSFVTTYSLIRVPALTKPLIRNACIASVAYLLSWISGGWYYVKHYGGAVKPVILEGQYPWAHQVFMEAKEHVFLFLPFATLALACALIVYRNDLAADPRLRHALFFLSLSITVIAGIITLSGILITGGAQ